jgi:hypothetical protein
MCRNKLVATELTLIIKPVTEFTDDTYEKTVSSG